MGGGDIRPWTRERDRGDAERARGSDYRGSGDG